MMDELAYEPPPDLLPEEVEEWRQKLYWAFVHVDDGCPNFENEPKINTLCDMALRSLRQSEREGWVCVSKAALERAIADAFMEHLERPENWRRVFEDEALWISREVVRRVTEGK